MKGSPTLEDSGRVSWVHSRASMSGAQASKRNSMIERFQNLPQIQLLKVLIVLKTLKITKKNFRGFLGARATEANLHSQEIPVGTKQKMNQCVAQTRQVWAGEEYRSIRPRFPFTIDCEVLNNQSLRIYLAPAACDVSGWMSLKIQRTVRLSPCTQDVASLAQKKNNNIIIYSVSIAGRIFFFHKL